MTPQDFTALAKRVSDIEDRLTIYNLIAAHPPSADTGSGFYSEFVYAEDGVFDRGEGLSGAVGNANIGSFLHQPAHTAAIENGLAHFVSLPHVEIKGDEAFVTSYHQIITPDHKAEPREVSNHGTSKGFRIHWVFANRWSLVRTKNGWKVKKRQLRPVDGSPPARELLKQALDPYRGAAE